MWIAGFCLGTLVGNRAQRIDAAGSMYCALAMNGIIKSDVKSTTWIWKDGKVLILQDERADIVRYPTEIRRIEGKVNIHFCE